jgi:2-methylfumaryl-CoA hydratase
MIPPDGPYFDDLTVGDVLDPAPAITITGGDVAFYQAVTGDPLRLALSHPLARAVTGDDRPLVNPAYAMHVSIGQSTVATRRVIANLFYRGVVLQRPVFVGDTLATTVRIRALKENSRRPDRPPRGMALLGITTVDQHGATVVDYERCAMVNLRNPDPTGHDDDLGPAAAPLDLAPHAAASPSGWDLSSLPAPARPWAVGEVRHDQLRDTVSSAVELARLTQNLAPVHRDASLGQGGRRLVYGGHTIGLAQASLCRLLPSVATIVGWHSCDHIGPVFEGDVLSFRSELLEEAPVPNGRLLAFSVIATTDRDGSATDVLDWRPVVLAR